MEIKGLTKDNIIKISTHKKEDTAIAGLYGANTDGTCNNGRAITNGLGCTARIIQDGYQMNY